MVQTRQRVRGCFPHLRLVSGCFTRPTGDLGLQLCRRTDHVETMAPPYVFVLRILPAHRASDQSGASGPRDSHSLPSSERAVRALARLGRRSCAVSASPSPEPAKTVAFAGLAGVIPEWRAKAALGHLCHAVSPRGAAWRLRLCRTSLCLMRMWPEHLANWRAIGEMLGGKRSGNPG